MKKALAFVFATILAIASCTPFVGACDRSYPNGISATTLTVTIPSCDSNYSMKSIDQACEGTRTLLLQYLNSVGGKTYTYVTDKSQANLIVYPYFNEIQTGDPNTVKLSYKTYGMGLTGDGHSLFTAFGEPTSDRGEMFKTAADKFLQFINNGWTCTDAELTR